jgi:2'-5' RNA ligase
LFLAINPTPDVQARIGEATAPLRDAAPGLRWVAPGRVHLTVRFLGEQPETRVAELSEAVDAAVTRHVDTPLVLEGVGAFPNFRRARVIWIGAQPHPRLELLHHDVEEACASLGFEPEGRPFRPHLTIARVPDGTPEDALRSVSRAARKIRLDTEMNVGSVDLMASELASGGARYRLLHASPLRTAA